MSRNEKAYRIALAVLKDSENDSLEAAIDRAATALDVPRASILACLDLLQRA